VSASLARIQPLRRIVERKGRFLAEAHGSVTRC
jgi:hypothetical protein